MRSPESAVDQSVVLESVVRAARLFAAITAESIAQAGGSVTLPQLRVLVLVTSRGPIANSVVAGAMGIHISNASRLCERLVQAGLLDRRDAPGNRRQVELTVTDAGVRLLDAVTTHRRSALSRILAEMSEKDQKTLDSALRIFAEAGEPLLAGRNLHIP